jgi:hypothetical protein
VKNYRSLLFGFAMMLCTLATAQSPTTEAPSISVEISTPDTTIQVGSSIMLSATMKNVSGHDLKYVITTASPLFEITVTTPTGKLAPETNLGQRRHSWLPRHGVTSASIFSTPQVLGAHKSIEVVEDVRKEYDIRQPGAYSVQVEVQDPEHRENKIKSNVIVFTLASP